MTYFLRLFRRKPETTAFQRCLAVHLYYATNTRTLSR